MYYVVRTFIWCRFAFPDSVRHFTHSNLEIQSRNANCSKIPKIKQRSENKTGNSQVMNQDGVPLSSVSVSVLFLKNEQSNRCKLYRNIKYIHM